MHRTQDLLSTTTSAAAIGCGLAAGVFFAFSTFVMPALRRLPSAQGIAAMQAINVAAVTPLFLGVLFGSGALCLGIAAGAWRSAEGLRRALLLGGAVSYLLGDLGLTAAFHVPRNDHLATVDPRSPGSASTWNHFLTAWTAGNHVRTIAGVAATAAFVAANRIG